MPTPSNFPPTLPSEPPVRVGDLLADKYRVESILGAGGMGMVVAALHLELDQRVAIKFLLPELVANPEAVARFAREARAAVKITNEHVARVSDVGKLENGAPFMVMEYLDGVNLSTWLADRGRLSVEEASDFMLQACEAIAEAHSLGIVHRDLKPSNLFVVRRSDGGQIVKLLDFGISKFTGSAAAMPDGAMTRTAESMGSPLYMSPEQIRSSKDVDHRTDIWSLGVILYELLTGVPPFDGATLPEVVYQITAGAPVSLREKRGDASHGLETVILRCLEKDPARRLQTIAELATQLSEFAPRRSRTSLERDRKSVV